MWTFYTKKEVIISSTKNKIWNHLKTEINQEKEFTKSTISSILYSKRLLVDHVESLENCLSDLDNAGVTPEPRNIFTIRNTCLLVAGTCLQAYFTPSNYKMTTVPLILASGTFTGVTVAKSFVSLKHKMSLNHLQSFIKSLDEFGNCIKRNTTYFNEILMMKSMELIETRQIERAWDCITSSKEVIEILYDATRKMEENYLLSDKYVELYSSMEELRESEYFKKNVTDYTPKDIKDFYNIFAYVQSQFLLRLALTTIQYPSNTVVSNEISTIREQIQEHVNEEEEHFKKLTLELKRKQIIEIAELQSKPPPMQKRSGPVAVLQESSLRLNSCMLAVADECHLLDETLQKLSEDIPSKPADEGKHLMEVANSMRLIEASLAVCCDDFHRLCLVYNRFLSLKLGTKNNNNLLITQTDVSNVDGLDSSLDPEESILRVEIINNNSFDDFYAYAFDENEKPIEVTQKDNRELEEELAFLDEKITKSTFRPVLRQLKGKIDPIRKEMLQKERQILKSKGINVDEFLGKEDGNEKNEEHSDSEGSADEAHEVSRKAYQQAKQFDEMRDYLAQKPRVNLFGLGREGESSVCGEEQILE